MKTARYIRQTALAGFGEEAQRQLGTSKVLVVGLGGLGIPVVQYLNAMGIHTLGIADQDVVELHNLQRQVIYNEYHIGRPKIEVAGAFLRAQNSGTEIREHDTFLSRMNALEIISGYDLVVDATDNFPTRYLINDACVILKKPFVYGALHGYEGQVSVFNYRGGATYRCLFPTMPGPEEIPDCNQNGVLGVLPGIVGTLQALEAVKCLTGVGEVLSNKLLLYDGLEQSVRRIRFNLNPANVKRTKLLDDYGIAECKTEDSISVRELVSLLESGKPIQLVDVRESSEFAGFSIAGSMNVPMNALGDFLNSVDESLPIYFICASGQRSQMATRQARKRIPAIGAINVLGGMHAYQALSP